MPFVWECAGVQPDGRSCGKVRMYQADAMPSLQKAGTLKPADLLARTLVVRGMRSGEVNALLAR